MDLDVFHHVVVPLLEIEHAVMIMISTPVDQWNFYSILARKRHPTTGKYIFQVCHVSFICRFCKRLRVGAEDCHHKMREIPPWKSFQKRQAVKSIFGGDMLETFQRESMGVITGDGGAILDPDIVRALEFKEPYVPNLAAYPEHIFVTFDPNGGGSNHAAVVAIVEVDNRIVVVGVDSHPTSDASEQNMLLTHFFMGLREHDWLANAKIVFCVENNSGLPAGPIYDHITNLFPNVFLLNQHVDKKQGWTTDNRNKIMYAYKTRNLVATGRVCFMKNIVCRNPWKDEYTRCRDTLKEFFTQMRRYREVVYLSKDAKRPKTVVVSGKTNSSGEVCPFNDDIMVMFTMACYLWNALKNEQIQSISPQQYRRLFSYRYT